MVVGVSGDVERCMVVFSRNVFLSPMMRKVGSCLYLRSCVSCPMAAKGKNRLSLPMVVCPSMTTCDLSVELSPMVTLSPMTQYGPMDTLFPMLADSEMMAV